MHAAEVRFGGGYSIGSEIPGSYQGLTKNGESPCPGCAVVIGRLSAGVLIPLVMAPIRVTWVIEQSTVTRMDGQRHRHGQRRQTTQCARNHEVPTGGLDTSFGALAARQPQADHQQTVAAEGIIERSLSGGLTASCQQNISVIPLLLAPEEFLERGLSLVGQVLPSLGLGFSPCSQRTQQPDPQSLDFHRIPFAR